MRTSSSLALSRRGRDSGKESLWRDRPLRQTRSGLSVRAFCSREGLKESGFYFWRREVGRRDRQARGGPGGPAVFVEVRGTGGAMPAAAGGVESHAPLELVLAGDRRLLIRDGCDGALLARVVAALEGLAC